VALGHGNIPMTVRAMKAGAVELLTKPFPDQDLLDAIVPAIAYDHVSGNSARTWPHCTSAMTRWAAVSGT
jgi:FixJ family two-component response regulator